MSMVLDLLLHTNGTTACSLWQYSWLQSRYLNFWPCDSLSGQSVDDYLYPSIALKYATSLPTTVVDLKTKSVEIQ
jgi:hypothetical protein